MAAHLQDQTKLSNGVGMPWLGLGVWQAKDGEEVVNSVKWALQSGYRSIDTAAVYDNEEGVGQGIKESGVSREEIFLTSKVWNSDQGYESTLQAFETSLKKLDTDYLDLYLIHWAVKDKYKETWRALETLYKEGKVRAIGVCNFQTHHLDDLMADCEIKPMVNQVELHPKLSQKELREYCRENNIQIEAWSPLGQGKLLQLPLLNEMADKYGKTAAQVILRWDLQNGIVTIPKSVHQDRIVQNADVFDFSLTDEEMAAIEGLNEDDRIGPDPDHFDF
ncbi:diketogulonate reductase-like aldo/keto reductase [Bacillus ectoiniformans]|uniref:aldo/keto reductase n=1 Tax=Bacillus ectoiniformans TaxID=1494429 RepID=UPI00195A317E|nr:aldo/keto reductase [Bacillus ectoiniformans]MBM7649195.1 diketogulonate reductase-like aldo/keto reductase [Bacillus ectoiniformans]